MFYDETRIYYSFYETNFLHLTGIKTFLSPLEFYKKCFDGKISCDDFDCDSSTQLKGLVRLKMRNMVNIDSEANYYKWIYKKDIGKINLVPTKIIELNDNNKFERLLVKDIKKSF